jgi:hypothetical protein
MADGRTALSQHRRRAHAKRRRRGRIGFLLVTTIIALAAIAAGVRLVITRAGVGTDPTAAALAGIPGSHSAALLEEYRQEVILEYSASKTLSLVGAPRLATLPLPSSGSSAGAGGISAVLDAAPPDPGTAQAIAWDMMPSFGFNPKTQFNNCLGPLWQEESSWRWNAENASGAYGIPQALPGSKMASAGPDWLTNPATQIKWGLGYIQSTYGTPCAAWAHEEADGWY